MIEPSRPFQPSAPAVQKPPRPLVSVLVPVFNEEMNIHRCYAAIVSVFETLDAECEIVFADNRSTDGSYALICDLAARDSRVRGLRFSRNYGYQRSILVLFQKARGDCAVQLDCDLQDPPALIPRMLDLWRQGHDVVYGIRRQRKEGPVVTALRAIFYRMLNAVAEDELPPDAAEFRLVDRRVLDELQRVEDTSPYLRGLIASMGFRQIGLPYERHARLAGESKFPFRKMVSLAVDGVLNHSLLPLRIASLTSLAVGAATFLLLCWYLGAKLLFGQDWPAGFATTTLLLLMSIMLNAMFLGIVGEYLGRIFQQVKRRPLPIVDATVGMEEGTGGPAPLELVQAAPRRRAAVRTAT